VSVRISRGEGMNFFSTAPAPAAWNMALDEALLLSAASIREPVFRTYSWSEPAATFGYFQKYAEIAAWTELRPLVRRPTGGGLVPHDADWTYSLALPPNDAWYELRAVESYLKLHEWLAAALRAVGVPAELAAVAQKEIPGQCFAGAEQFDVLVNGKKVAGAAQRRTRDGMLIQGSVQRIETVARAAWEKAMFDLAPGGAQMWKLPQTISDKATELAESKYSQESYNRRR
jgi:lipoate-protein ligase A